MAEEFKKLESNEQEVALIVLKTKLSEKGLRKIETVDQEILILEDSDFIDLPNLRQYAKKIGNPMRKDQWYKLAFSPAL